MAVLAEVKRMAPSIRPHPNFDDKLALSAGDACKLRRVPSPSQVSEVELANTNVWCMAQ
jgi:hypothetical protein